MCDSKFYCSIHVLPCSITHLILSLASLALADAHTQISHALSLWLWLSKHWGLSPTGVEVLGRVRYTANRNAKLWSPSLCKTRYLEYITLNHFNCDLPTTHSRDPAPVRAFQIPFPSKLSAFFPQKMWMLYLSCTQVMQQRSHYMLQLNRHCERTTFGCHGACTGTQMPRGSWDGNGMHSS